MSRAEDDVRRVRAVPCACHVIDIAQTIPLKHFRGWMHSISTHALCWVHVHAQQKCIYWWNELTISWIYLITIENHRINIESKSRNCELVTPSVSQGRLYSRYINAVNDGKFVARPRLSCVLFLCCVIFSFYIRHWLLRQMNDLFYSKSRNNSASKNRW